MPKIVTHIIYVFLFIYFSTVVVVLSGVLHLWFTPGAQEPPFLRCLLGTFLVETAGVIFGITNKGLKYLPTVEVNNNKKETSNFLGKFISSGSTVTVVSNRVAWLKESALLNKITSMAENGICLEIITPLEVGVDIRIPLEAAGVHFYVTKEKDYPEARFTLVDGNRTGSERLAIAKGSHPEHEITIFDNASGPQIIAMANDIIRKSKELANANKMV